MKLRLMAAVAMAAALYSCDDSTTGVGDFVSGLDKIEAFSKTYNVASSTEQVDKVYARTNRAYLGKYTDPDFGSFTADFITQINCPEDFEFPDEKNLSIESAALELIYRSFYGDSLANLKLQVDELDKVIEEEDRELLYTTYNPEGYYDKTVPYIARKTYAVADHALSDSIRNELGYYYHDIDLGEDFCKKLHDKYKEDKGYFKDSYNFIRNVLKGFYVHVIQGDGSIIYIDDISLRMKIKYDVKRPSTGVVDSTVYAITRFSASKEVLTSARMVNDHDELQKYVDDKKHTYLKTPAGLYTKIALPIDEMYAEHQDDTLNSVTLSIKKYRYAGLDEANEEKSPYKMGVPQNILMVRAVDYEGFFENNKINDDKTSFLATYNATSNSYSFSKLNRLISQIFAEKRSGQPLNSDYDKVYLIPVTTEVDEKNTGTVIGISNDLSVSAAKLFGGVDGEKLEIEVTYTNP